MNAILVTPKFGGRAHILGPYTDQELAQKMKSLSTKYDRREVVKILTRGESEKGGGIVKPQALSLNPHIMDIAPEAQNPKNPDN